MSPCWKKRQKWPDGRAIPAFISQALAGKPLTVFGKGAQTRSFCFVDDLVDGILQLMQADYHDPVNLGNPEEYTILQLAQQIVTPVDWVGIAQRLASDGATVFVEVGPKGVLGGLTAKTLGNEVHILSLDRLGTKEHGDRQLKRALAQLAALGVPVDPAPLLAERLPAAPLTAGSKATVWLGGANHRNPETLDPPMPELPDVPVPSVTAAAAAPEATSSWADLPKGTAPMAKPVHLEASIDQRASVGSAPLPAPGVAPAAAPAEPPMRPAPAPADGHGPRH